MEVGFEYHAEIEGKKLSEKGKQWIIPKTTELSRSRCTS